MEKSSRPVRNRRHSRRAWPPGDTHRPVKRLFTPEIKRMLKDWLVRRRENPYPSRDEKKALAYETGLTYTQICNWFANWRRKLKNSGREPSKKTWGHLIKNYNTNAKGNVEQFSICSSDSIWGDEEENRSNSNFSSSPKSHNHHHLVDKSLSREYESSNVRTKLNCNQNVQSYASNTSSRHNLHQYPLPMHYHSRNHPNSLLETMNTYERYGNDESYFNSKSNKDEGRNPYEYFTPSDCCDSRKNCKLQCNEDANYSECNPSSREVMRYFQCNLSPLSPSSVGDEINKTEIGFDSRIPYEEPLQPSVDVERRQNQQQTVSSNGKYKNQIMEKYLRDTITTASIGYTNNGTSSVSSSSCSTTSSASPELSKWLESAANFTPNKNNYIEWNSTRPNPKGDKRRSKFSECSSAYENSLHQKEELDAAEALANLACNYRQKQMMNVSTTNLSSTVV